MGALAPAILKNRLLLAPAIFGHFDISVYLLFIQSIFADLDILGKN